MDERRNRFHPWQAHLIIMGRAPGAGDVLPRKGAFLPRNEGSESQSEKELLIWGEVIVKCMRPRVSFAYIS